jgi:hypothetical protein
MAYINEAGEVIITIPSLEDYRDIKNSIIEVFQIAAMAKGNDHLELDGNTLYFFLELTRLMDLDIDTVKQELLVKSNTKKAKSKKG